MRRTAVVLSLGIVLVGCSLLKKKGANDDAGVDPGAGDAQVSVTGTGAKNEKDVLRYKNEEKLNDEASTIGKDGVKARTFPGDGVEVATLTKGTTVAKVAKYFATAVLVSFDDPAGGGKLLGWVTPESLAAPAAATDPKPAYTATRPNDAGTAKDGGTRDAGAAKDAGSTPSAVADPGKTVVLVPPVAGKCPSGFALVGALCRRSCNADPDCPKGAKCVNKGGKYCSRDN